MMNKYQEAFDNLYANQVDDGVENYANIEAIQELVGKATPKTPSYKTTRPVLFNDPVILYYCPVCHTKIANKGECCPNNDCRQFIDWSDEDE